MSVGRTRTNLEPTHHVVTFVIRFLDPSGGVEYEAPTVETEFDFDPSTIPAFLRTTAVASKKTLNKLVALNINNAHVRENQHVFRPPRIIARDGRRIVESTSHAIAMHCTESTVTPGVRPEYIADALTLDPAHAPYDWVGHVAFVSVLVDTTGLRPRPRMADVPADQILAYAIFCVGIPDHAPQPATAYDLVMQIDVVAARGGHGTRILDYLASRFEGPAVPANRRCIVLHSINYIIATDEKECTREGGFSLNKFYSTVGYANTTSCSQLVKGRYTYSVDGNTMVNCLGHERAYDATRLTL